MNIPGRNPVYEALQSTHPVSRIFIQADANIDAKLAKVLSTAEERKIKVEKVSTQKLDQLVAHEHHQGIVAEVDFTFASLNTTELNLNGSMYLYVREAQYEHNLGAIIRTAEVAGIAGIIIPPKQEITGVTARISMGAIFHIPIFKSSLFPTLKHFRSNGFRILALERGGTETVFEADLLDCLLVVGGEDKEISDELKNHCDLVVSIPQYGKINSLNMSVASALAIYAHTQQRTDKQPL